MRLVCAAALLICLAVAAISCEKPPQSDRSPVVRPLPEGSVGVDRLTLPNKATSVKFAVIGDSGRGTPPQFEIAARMAAYLERFHFPFVIMLGDNIYEGPATPEDYRRKFEEPYRALLDKRIKFYAVLGNHDVREGRQDQRDYPLFNMTGQYYYSLKKGDGLVEFFLLDSNDLGAEQLAWLENALRASTAKWKIATFHHPLYSSGKRHGSSDSRRRLLEPLFTKYGVNVVFSAHDHMYERTKPQQGIQYFVTGAGGKTRRGTVDLKSEIRAASYDEDNHFMLVEVDDKQVSFQAIGETGAIIDSGSIKQP